MTCHSSGRSPTIAIGLGPLVTPSRIRMPRPPQKSTTFMIHPARNDLELGDREDELAAPLPDVAELVADFVPEIPRQDQNVVGLGLGQALRRVDRDMRARQELALLDRAAVDRVREQVGPDTAVVEQRVALARGAVADHRLPSRAA